jgi:hypothetical protein
MHDAKMISNLEAIYTIALSRARKCGLVGFSPTISNTRSNFFSASTPSWPTTTIRCSVAHSCIAPLSRPQSTTVESLGCTYILESKPNVPTPGLGQCEIYCDSTISARLTTRLYQVRIAGDFERTDRPHFWQVGSVSQPRLLVVSNRMEDV